MILNNTVQQVAMRTFRGMTPIRTGKLRYDAVKLIPIMNYNKFSIYVDAQIAPYGHILRNCGNDQVLYRAAESTERAAAVYPAHK